MKRFPDAPAGIAALPVEERGYPIPWFVPMLNGLPEFRAVDPRRIAKAHREGRCWICGGKMSTFKAFVVGPMCAVNRVSAEPPSHRSCARFAVTACPFLTKPLAKRRDASDLEHAQPPGVMIERNPGVSLIWIAQTYRAEKQPEGGLLFRMGTPIKTEWWANGRMATRAEVIESIETGLPILAKLAKEEGPEAMLAFEHAIDRTVKLIPAE